MIDTVLVGKNSFLARQFEEFCSSANILFLSHNEALLNPEYLNKARVVVNFSFPSELSTKSYEHDLDIDNRLARLIGSQTYYVMLSSRMVYGDANENFIFKENAKANPTSHYGRNKLIVENGLKEIVESQKLIILRLSNVFGFEPQRKTFFGTALTSLYMNKYMTFDIAAESVRDFLPVNIFSKYLNKILTSPKAGLFNLGSGIGVSCFDVTQWIIDGYGEGHVNFSSLERRGDFILDTTQAKKTFLLPDTSLEEIRKACVDCGERLKAKA